MYRYLSIARTKTLFAIIDTQSMTWKFYAKDNALLMLKDQLENDEMFNWLTFYANGALLLRPSELYKDADSRYHQIDGYPLFVRLEYLYTDPITNTAPKENLFVMPYKTFQTYVGNFPEAIPYIILHGADGLYDSLINGIVENKDIKDRDKTYLLL